MLLYYCFNPRAPRGARRGCFWCEKATDVFQSTRPARGATRLLNPDAIQRLVSIHAPRAGRDLQTDSTIMLTDSFNPRAPRGARRLQPGICDFVMGFQSTRPARGATPETLVWMRLEQVSIHAPRAGRDGRR